MDVKQILEENKNIYTFEPEEHIYCFSGKKVEVSVTKFISKYFEEFDTETISYYYAKKNNLLQEDVKAMWKKTGDISANSGTVIHAYLESLKNNLEYKEDYSQAIKNNLEKEVRERVKLLTPKADKFHEDTKLYLEPLATEYTVGLKEKLAGNIDLLAYNNKEKEIQIWDYKNCKSLSVNSLKKCFKPFEDVPDTNYGHYSLQLSCYKALLKNMLNIDVGKLNLVHFDYTKEDNNYRVYKALDLSDRFLDIFNSLDPSYLPPIGSSIYGSVPF